MKSAKLLGLIFILALSFLMQIKGQEELRSERLELLNGKFEILSERLNESINKNKTIPAQFSKLLLQFNESNVILKAQKPYVTPPKNLSDLEEGIKVLIQRTENMKLLLTHSAESEILDSQQEQELVSEIEVFLKEIKSFQTDIKKEKDSKVEQKLAEKIGGLKPMTAVLFTSLDRNRFEVVKDPNSTNMDPATGIINQETSGNTAGILLAMEAPFWYPDLGGPRIPIGGWFGLNLTNGQDDTFENFNLAAGLSFILVSQERIDAMLKDTNFSIVDAARLLVGVTYGNATELGQGLEVGNEFPLGEVPFVQKEGKFKVAVGLGFRF